MAIATCSGESRHSFIQETTPVLNRRAVDQGKLNGGQVVENRTALLNFRADRTWFDTVGFLVASASLNRWLALVEKR